MQSSICETYERSDVCYFMSLHVVMPIKCIYHRNIVLKGGGGGTNMTAEIITRVCFDMAHDATSPEVIKSFSC